MKYFKAEWFWGRNVDQWIKAKIIGHTLNFPCGMSKVGDVRADKDKEVKPDLIADIRAPEVHFKKGQFDTLICDPPFQYWALDKIGKWFPDICGLATKRLIFRAPLVRLYPPKTRKAWRREYFITLKHSSLTLNMFHVFTNPNLTLDEIK